MDEILTKEEFLKKDLATQKMLLTHWREIYNNQEIMKSMMITNNNAFSQLVKSLDLPKKIRAYSPRKAKVKTKEKVKPNPPQESKPKENMGLNLTYQGSYNAEQFSKILSKIITLVEGEKTQFSISLTMTENR